MKKGKILFIDSTHGCLKEDLTNYGFECHYFPTYKRNDFEIIVSDYIGIIIRSKIQIDKRFLEKASNLKFIGRVGSGMENIDTEYAKKCGISCLNSPEGNRDAVAEHAMGLLLSLLNKISLANRDVKNGLWEREKNRGTEIKGKTIGMIGFGNTGSAFAKRLRGFEATVIAYDKYKTGYGNSYVKEVPLKTIFEQSDILSMHIPLTEETKYMLNNEFLSAFSKEIFFINTSRGEIVDTEDLLIGINSGKIRGAAIDVLEYENQNFQNIFTDKENSVLQKLLQSSKVIITPHVAGWTFESNIRLCKVLFEKIKKVIY